MSYTKSPRKIDDTCPFAKLFNSEYKIRMRSVVFGVVATFILGAHTLAIADWQLVNSNVVSGTVLPFTNLVVRKLSAEVCREDNFPSFSRIIFASRREQVTLNHSDKTYVRQPLPDESTQLQPPP